MPRMTGNQYFAEAMRGYGVSHLFFVPTIMLPAMAAMEDMGIRRVVTHGEKAAAYMADGYARAAHRPGICLAQNIGAANLAAGLRDAAMACSPVIAVTGGTAPHSRYRNQYQEVEDFTMFDPVTKLNAEVESVERLPDLLRLAFRTATTGAPGPVHLRMQGTHGQILEEEADLDLVVEPECAQYPVFRFQAEAEAVQAAVRALADAQRPVIVAGGGVVASGAERELLDLAERYAIPVATSLNAKAALPDRHPLNVGVVGSYSRACANQIVAEADLVFFIGSRTGSQVTNTWKVPRPGTTVLQLDVDPAQIGRNYPVQVGLLGDVRTTLRQVLGLPDGVEPHAEWAKHAQGVVADWRAQAEPLATSDAVPIRPERICRELSEFLPPEAVVVADTGHSGIWTGTTLELQLPTQRYIRCAGSLGWAFPASLGVKCALPDTPVFCFCGDGGFYYHLAELETAARYGINAVIVVNDNHALSQEQRLFNAAYGGTQRGDAHQMWVFNEVNLAAVAEAMGCFAVRVERPADLQGALERALASGRPAVVDVAADLAALGPRPLD